MYRIGIVGGGQLGRMLSFDAKKMGFYVTVIDPTPQSPAGQVSDLQIVADYKDAKAIRKLGRISDVITFEIELANDKVLNELVKKGISVNPSPKTLGIIRDKLLQKQFLKKNKLKTADFFEIKKQQDILKAEKLFGYPFLLKARTDAYDGRGNAFIQAEKDISHGIEKLQGRALYVERYVPFVKELSVVVARSTQGEIKTYPVVETRHVDNICDVVLAPAHISKKAQKCAELLARQTMKKLKGAGVFAIEMFLDRNDNVLINEIAPRVHNSAHYTIEACVTSQFEQHIRAVSGLPLGETRMKVKAAVMKNILGKKNGIGVATGIQNVLQMKGATLHLYGKTESRVQRKMGHITVVGDTISECLKKAEKARKYITI